MEWRSKGTKSLISGVELVDQGTCTPTSPVKVLKTNSAIFKSILKLTGSQCRVVSVGEQQRFSVESLSNPTYRESHQSSLYASQASLLFSGLWKNDVVSLQWTSKADTKHLWRLPILSIKFKTTVKRDIEIFEKTAAINSKQTKEAALFSAFKLLY